MALKSGGTIALVLIVSGIAILMPDDAPISLRIGAYSLFCLFVFSFFFAHYFQIKKILSATKAIAAGKLETRVDKVHWGPVNPIVDAINDMALRIETLVNAQRELTRAVSHELRTPVARMRFGLEMMESASDDDERAQRRDRIEKDIDELDQLIDELLTYARLEDGAPPLNFREVELERIIYTVVEKARKSGSDKIIDFHVDDAIDLAVVEPRFIQRAAQNLIMNAVKYAHERINVRVLLENNDYFLVVDDDGPGIPHDRRLDIFEPFARLDKSRTRETGGYGLGLAIVSRIAKWHKGKVSISDSELGGAHFVISWPRDFSKN